MLSKCKLFNFTPLNLNHIMTNEEIQRLATIDAAIKQLIKYDDATIDQAIEYLQQAKQCKQWLAVIVANSKSLEPIGPMLQMAMIGTQTVACQPVNHFQAAMGYKPMEAVEPVDSPDTHADSKYVVICNHEKSTTLPGLIISGKILGFVNTFELGIALIASHYNETQDNNYTFAKGEEVYEDINKKEDSLFVRLLENKKTLYTIKPNKQ